MITMGRRDGEEDKRELGAELWRAIGIT